METDRGRGCAMIATMGSIPAGPWFCTRCGARCEEATTNGLPVPVKCHECWPVSAATSDEAPQRRRLKDSRRGWRTPREVRNLRPVARRWK